MPCVAQAARCRKVVLARPNRLVRSRPALRLDLAGVDFVDRSGIRALRRLSRKGIEIFCPSGPVASVLEGEGIRVTQDGVGDEQF